MIYFAVFEPAEDKPGVYCISFPDLPGCFTEGDNLSDALFNASECLTSYLEAENICKNILPLPSSADEIRKARPDLPKGSFIQAVETNPFYRESIASEA